LLKKLVKTISKQTIEKNIIRTIVW
jgi:hypothetical protein